jgi:hypothetical protein
MGMTEQEWLASTDLQVMLEFLRASGGLSSRKYRLLFVAVCRHLNGKSGTLKQAIEVAERYADGRTGPEEVEAAKRGTGPFGYLYSEALLGTEPSGAFYLITMPPRSRRRQLRRAAHASLVRDILGPLPFRSVTVLPSARTWSGGTVIKLAQAAYDDRLLRSGHLDPNRLAVLADALEEAGCADPDILGHCRSSGVHVRGCWVLDLVLEKE